LKLKQTLTLLAQGDEQAASELFKTYAPKIRLFIRLKFQFSPEDVDDILAETFLRFFRSIIKQQYRQDANIQTYLSKIAYNESLRLIEKHKAENQQRVHGNWEEIASLLDQQISPDDPKKALLYQQCIDCLTHSLDDFSQDTRDLNKAKDCITALTLKIEGWSIKEIAQTLQRSESASKQLLYSCRQRLRPYLKTCQALCDIDD